MRSGGSAHLARAAQRSAARGGTGADAFDVVIPSLPGFGFSDKPTTRGWNADRTARAWAVLMQRLGYTRYVALAAPEGVTALHSPRWDRQIMTLGCVETRSRQGCGRCYVVARLALFGGNSLPLVGGHARLDHPAVLAFVVATTVLLVKAHGHGKVVGRQLRDHRAAGGRALHRLFTRCGRDTLCHLDELPEHGRENSYLARPGRAVCDLRGAGASGGTNDGRRKACGSS